ncbi:MAG: ABC transporter permease [Pyrinomonadaceae bacterium]
MAAAENKSLTMQNRREIWLKNIALGWELFLVALGSLRANKLRTFLTLLGVIVGVASVIAVVTIINGLEQTISTTFSSQGSTAFTVSKRPLIITSREQLIETNKRRDVTQEDAEAIKRLCTLCWRLSYSAQGREIVKHNDAKSEDVPTRGVTLEAFDIEALTIDAGRVWTDAEEKSGQNVCVIGQDVVKNVFDSAPLEQIVGQTIRVGGLELRVVGVTTALGSVFGFSRDNFVNLPYQTAQKLFGSRGSLVINIQVPTAATFESAKDQVRSIMRNRRGKSYADEDDGFALESQDVFVGLFNSATSNIFLVTILVSALSLVVGGIVVMNIMLVSVTERTKEIGIRKSMGARRKDILGQFLVESLTVTSIGGVIGVLSGFALAFLISKAIGFPMLASIWSAVMGVGVSSVVGLVSGIYPAWRAARLDPIEALRAE